MTPQSEPQQPSPALWVATSNNNLPQVLQALTLLRPKTNPSQFFFTPQLGKGPIGSRSLGGGRGGEGREKRPMKRTLSLDSPRAVASTFLVSPAIDCPSLSEEPSSSPSSPSSFTSSSSTNTTSTINSPSTRSFSFSSSSSSSSPSSSSSSPSSTSSSSFSFSSSSSSSSSSLTLEEIEQIINYQDPLFGRTALFRACGQANPVLPSLLLSHPLTDVNLPTFEGATPLFIACQENNLHVVLLLLSHPLLIPNSPNCYGATPFHVACQEGHVELVSLLLEHPCIDVLRPNQAGLSPFMVACQEGHDDVIRVLLQHPRTKKEIHRRREGDLISPLHLACRYGRGAVVAILLEEGKADVTLTTSLGFTALHVACEFRRFDAIEMLLQHGAEINARSKAGKSPFSLAQEKGDQEVMTRLLSSARGMEVQFIEEKRKTREILLAGDRRRVVMAGRREVMAGRREMPIRPPQGLLGF